MLKKLIGLGMTFGVVGAALMGGCSSSSTTVVAGDSGAGSVDSGNVIHPDSGVTPTDGGNSMSTSGMCPAAVDTTMIPAWKAPKTGTTGACSSADIAALNAKAADTTATFTDLYMSIPAACQACVFSAEMDATWQPIVWSPDMASGTAFVNFGACYDVAPSGSAACGKGVQDDEFCLEAACPDTCTDQTGCLNSADSGVCKTQGDEVTTGCGSAVTSLNAKCSKFIDGITIVCGSGSVDGGGG